MRRLQIVAPAPFARVLFIVVRDQRALVEFLRKDLAVEEAERLIEIRLDRRQSPMGQDAQPRETEGRRDPHCTGLSPQVFARWAGPSLASRYNLSRQHVPSRRLRTPLLLARTSRTLVVDIDEPRQRALHQALGALAGESAPHRRARALLCGARCHRSLSVRSFLVAVAGGS